MTACVGFHCELPAKSWRALMTSDRPFGGTSSIRTSLDSYRARCSRLIQMRGSPAPLRASWLPPIMNSHFGPTRRTNHSASCHASLAVVPCSAYRRASRPTQLFVVSPTLAPYRASVLRMRVACFSSSARSVPSSSTWGSPKNQMAKGPLMGTSTVIFRRLSSASRFRSKRRFRAASSSSMPSPSSFVSGTLRRRSWARWMCLGTIRGSLAPRRASARVTRSWRARVLAKPNSGAISAWVLPSAISALYFSANSLSRSVASALSRSA